MIKYVEDVNVFKLSIKCLFVGVVGYYNILSGVDELSMIIFLYY